MNLIEALATPPPRHSSDGPGKSIRDWIATRPQEEQAAVMAAAKDPAWGHRALIDVLTTAGMPGTTDNTMRNWRIAVGWRATS